MQHHQQGLPDRHLTSHMSSSTFTAGSSGGAARAGLSRSARRQVNCLCACACVCACVCVCMCLCVRAR
jgi:hypothetical protein